MNYFYDLPTEIQRKIKFYCLSGELLDCILKRNDKITQYESHQIWLGDDDTYTSEKRKEINTERFWENAFDLIELIRVAHCPVFCLTMPNETLLGKIIRNGLILPKRPYYREILIQILLKY